MLVETEVRVFNYLDAAIHFVYLPQQVLLVVVIREEKGAWLNDFFRFRLFGRVRLSNDLTNSHILMKARFDDFGYSRFRQ